jgi:hypothetical protein
MTEHNGAVSEEDKIVAITKRVTKLNESQWPLRVHMSLKEGAFNANGIGKQCFELSKHLQDHHIDMALLRDTKTSSEILHSKLPRSSDRSLSRPKMQTCHQC